MVIVPPTLTLRGSTLERLEKFQAAGGRVIFAGDVAVCCDAVESDRAKKLAEKSETIPFTRNAVLTAVNNLRDVAVIRSADGYPMDKLLYQMREEGADRYLFLVNTERLGLARDVIVKVRGSWQVEYLDTMTGESKPVAGRQENGWTLFDYAIYPHGHLLVKLTPSDECKGERIGTPLLTDAQAEAATEAHLSGTIPVSLDEPNVLLLDRPKWRMAGDAEWQPAEEILRLDNKVRARLGQRERGGHIVQPWVYGKSTEVLGTLELAYTIETLIDVESPLFAMEEPDNAELFLDGVKVPFEDNGYWTDRSLRTGFLPKLTAGTHELVVKIAYTRSGNVERCFLLGDFGVELRGDTARIVEPVRELVWGDVTRQGLPFYGGQHHLSLQIHAVRGGKAAAADSVARDQHAGFPEQRRRGARSSARRLPRRPRQRRARRQTGGRARVRPVPVRARGSREGRAYARSDALRQPGQQRRLRASDVPRPLGRPGRLADRGRHVQLRLSGPAFRHHGRAAVAEEITPGRRRLNRRLRYGRKPESGVSGAPGPGFLFRPASRNRRGRRTERHYRP